MSDSLIPGQVEIGFDQFKTAMVKGGAVPLSNLPYFFSSRFTLKDWELESDFLVTPSDKVLVGKKRTAFTYPWCVVMTIREKGKPPFERVCDFPATCTVQQMKQFCFRMLQIEVVNRLADKLDRAKLFQKVLSAFS